MNYRIAPAHTKLAPTMADVAKLAGVSAMTVSRALRQEGSVSERTRARILEVIDEIGYVPDQAAGALSSGRSGLVGAILPTLTIPTFPLVARGLTETLAAEGLELFLAFSDYSADREERILKAILRRRPEAIVLAGVDHSEKAARLLAASGVPVVEFFDKPRAPIDHVLAFDHEAAGRASVAYLARKGRRRLGFATSKSGADPRGEARLEGVLKGARELGLPAPIVLRHSGPLWPLDQGQRAAAELTESHSDVDALVCMNDYVAVGATSELRRRGVAVPTDVAVLGFGDCDIARHVEPAISTIGFNAVVIGVEIGKLLISALERVRLGRSPAPYHVTLDFQVIERASA